MRIYITSTFCIGLHSRGIRVCTHSNFQVGVKTHYSARGICWNHPQFLRLSERLLYDLLLPDLLDADELFLSISKQTFKANLHMWHLARSSECEQPQWDCKLVDHDLACSGEKLIRGRRICQEWQETFEWECWILRRWFKDGSWVAMDSAVTRMVGCWSVWLKFCDPYITG